MIATGLSTAQGTADFGIKMENVGINSNWSFAARVASLQTQDGSNQELTGAQLSFEKQLQHTTDGMNWQPITQDFEGLSEPTASLLPMIRRLNYGSRRVLLQGKGNLEQRLALSLSSCLFRETWLKRRVLRREDRMVNGK